MIADWQPISEFDAMPRDQRPIYCAFLFRPELNLGLTVQLQRNFGRRTCIGWAEIENPSPEIRSRLGDQIAKPDGRKEENGVKSKEGGPKAKIPKGRRIAAFARKTY